MFNWICPECGRDVSPSESECRYCAERKKAAAEIPVPAVDPAPAYSVPPPQQSYGAPPPQQPYAPSQPQQPLYSAPPPQQSYSPPPPTQNYPPPPTQHNYPPPPTQQQPYTPPQQPYYQAPPPQAHQPYYPPEAYPQPKKSLPTWALALLFAVGFIGIIAAIFFAFQWRGSRAERAGVTEPAAAARSKTANPLQKYLEVVGIRLIQDERHRPQARFIVVNHSNAELNDLNANVTIFASTSRSDEDAVGTFKFKLDSIAGNESKEVTAPFTTKLKIYELPDWQNATADIQLTQP
jgi:hypothetical protein